MKFHFDWKNETEKVNQTERILISLYFECFGTWFMWLSFFIMKIFMIHGMKSNGYYIMHLQIMSLNWLYSPMGFLCIHRKFLFSSKKPFQIESRNSPHLKGPLFHFKGVSMLVWDITEKSSSAEAFLLLMHHWTQNPNYNAPTDGSTSDLQDQTLHHISEHPSDVPIQRVKLAFNKPISVSIWYFPFFWICMAYLNV